MRTNLPAPIAAAFLCLGFASVVEATLPKVPKVDGLAPPFVQVNAYWTSAAELATQCARNDHDARLWCVGYLQGIDDITTAATGKSAWCATSSTSAEDLREAYLDWFLLAEDHIGPMAAPQVVLAAMTWRFPCAAE